MLFPILKVRHMVVVLIWWIEGCTDSFNLFSRGGHQNYFVLLSCSMYLHGACTELHKLEWLLRMNENQRIWYWAVWFSLLPTCILNSCRQQQGYYYLRLNKTSCRHLFSYAKSSNACINSSSTLNRLKMLSIWRIIINLEFAMTWE